jgi:myo-inositol-1(or 4)-monophosphatase
LQDQPDLTDDALTLVTEKPLSTADLDAREQLCRSLLVSAGEIAMDGYARLGGGATFTMKGPQDFLTETDGQVEDHIRKAIAAAFPEDGFLGEESGGSASERMWVVDPIDGTANFMRGIPHFCTSIAFVDGGRVEIGGIANPASDEIYFARRGRGASRDDRPIRVSATDAFDRCSIEFGWSPRVPNQAYLDRLAAVWALGVNVRRSGSGALGLAYVADGRSDGYAELHINSWDCLAGLLLVEEAGGVCNDFLADGGLMAGNPVLAAAPGVAAGLSRVTGIPLPAQPLRSINLGGK